MWKFISNIFLAFICINISHAQEYSKIKCGLQVIAPAFNTIDLELQYAFNPHLSASLSGGYQFKMKVPDPKNSENGRASGSFIRAGLMFIPGKPDGTVRYFIKAEVLFSHLKHETSLVFNDSYENFSIPFEDESNIFGGAIGHGLQIYLSENFEADFFGMIGFSEDTENFVGFGYFVPGHSMKLFPDIYMRPGINFKYKFRKRTKVVKTE